MRNENVDGCIAVTVVVIGAAAIFFFTLSVTAVFGSVFVYAASAASEVIFGIKRLSFEQSFVAAFTMVLYRVALAKSEVVKK